MPKTRLDPALILSLAFTQMIGWGTTYYLPSMLSLPLQREMGLSTKIIYAAVAAMMITGAVLSPMLGRYLDRASARPVMTSGSVLCALGLAILSQVHDGLSYILAWIVIGVSSIMVLSLSAHAAVVKAYGPEARRALTLLVVAGGWAVTIFWPLGEFLLRFMSWRQVVLIYALVHLLVCAPIHAIFVGRIARTPHAETPPSPPLPMPGPAPEPAQSVQPRLPPTARRAGFGLTVLAFAPAGFVSWGLPLHFVELFQGAGLGLALSVWLGSLSGPSQMFARILQWLWLDRFIDPVKLALWAALATIPIVALPLYLAFDELFAMAFVVSYGVTSGVTSMARATLPLVLFGAGGFGALIGRLALPLNLVFAISPVVYAAVVERGGAEAAIVMSLLLVIVSGLAFGRLAQMARAGQPKAFVLDPSINRS